MTKKDIHIDFENNILVLKGERTEDKELKEENYYRKEMVYTGTRLTAEQCVMQNIVKEACPAEQLMDKTMQYAKTLNKSRAYIKEMRHRLCKDIIYALEVEDIPYIESERFFVR